MSPANTATFEQIDANFMRRVLHRPLIEPLRRSRLWRRYSSRVREPLRARQVDGRRQCNRPPVSAPVFVTAWLQSSAAKGPRVFALEQEIRKSAAVAVRAMSVVQILTRMRAVGSPVCHRHPARRAQLPPLCHHAFRSLRHVRSELRTKPHRIRRASLARLWAALSGSVGDPHQAQSNQWKYGEQRWAADALHGTHHIGAPHFHSHEQPRT